MRSMDGLHIVIVECWNVAGEESKWPSLFNNIHLSIPHICISANILLAIGNKILESINIIAANFQQPKAKNVIS